MKNYEFYYHAYQKLAFIDRDLFGLFVKRHLEEMFGERMNAELDALHKQVFPRRRKIVHKNIPQGLVDPVVKKWQERALAWLKCANGRIAFLKYKLRELAPTTRLEPSSCEQMLFSESTSTYRSQGFGAYRYAENAAQRRVDLLQENGFEAEIRKIAQTNKDGKQWGTRFEVWTNAAPWQLDCCERRPRDLFDECVKLWKRGVNPKVYWPFLPYDIFTSSCDVAMASSADNQIEKGA